MSRSAPVRAWPRLLLAVAATLTAWGCEIENPSAVTLPETNPLRLVRGAAYMVEVFANDYGNKIINAIGEGGTGAPSDPYSILFFERNFTWLHEARVLAAYAIDRAEEEGDAEVLDLAHVWHGWIMVRLTEIWGAQPLGDFKIHPEEELFATALADFEAAKNATVDSVRFAARAGIARVNWILGRDPVDTQRLQAAIAAAQQVLDEAPAFHFAPIPGRPTYLAAFTPAPGFEHIPIWTRDPSQPQGVKLIDADELRLIQAEARLLMNDLPGAKQAVKSTALLPINHVGLAGRDPEGDPLTAEEIDAFIDPMDAAQLMFVIEELRRENFFTHGRRNFGPKEDGTMFPLALPKGA